MGAKQGSVMTSFLLFASPPGWLNSAVVDLLALARLQLLLFLDSGKESGLGAKSIVQSSPWKMVEKSTKHLDCKTQSSKVQHVCLHLAYLFKQSQPQTRHCAYLCGELHTKYKY